MPLTVWPPRHGFPAHALRELEHAVRDVLGDTEETFDVQFGTWASEDGRIQYVCRIEGPPCDPFGAYEQWRWWSPIVSGPDELRESLRIALTRRSAVARAEVTAEPRAAVP